MDRGWSVDLTLTLLHVLCVFSSVTAEPTFITPLSRNDVSNADSNVVSRSAACHVSTESESPGIMCSSQADSTLISTDTTQVAENPQSTSNSYQVVPYASAVPSLLPLLQEAERQFQFAGREWVIEQKWDQIGLAAVVWEAAIALCQYLESEPSLVDGHRVIELGAGTGLAGMVASALGASSVSLTDKLTFSAEANLYANRHNLAGKQVTVSRLEWGCNNVTHLGPPFDVILAADVVYSEETFPLLIKSFGDLSSLETTLLLAHKQRYREREMAFFDLLSKAAFELEVAWSLPEHSVTIYNIYKRYKHRTS